MRGADRPALGAILDVRRGERVTGSALSREVRRRARLFAALGVGPGTRAALWRANGWELFADLLAVWDAGACAVVLDPSLPFPALAAALASSRSMALFTGRPRPSGAKAPRLWLDPGAERTSLRPALPPRAPEAPALILQTSGSSGEPKGVVHTRRGLASRLAALRAEIGPRALRRALCVLPACFGHGLIGNGLLPLLSGGELVLAPESSAASLADLGRLADESRATFLSSVPALWRLVLSLGRPPARGTLERVHCASAPLSAELWAAARAWTGGADLRNVYGMTETASWIAGTARGEAPDRGLVGRGWGARLAVRGGEVWVRTASLMSGYDGHPPLGPGWHRTGDLGRLDSRGRLFLTGRRGETINRAGLKIEPQEIDLVLQACPAVRDACAFALHDPLAGQAVGAAVVLARPSGRARTLAAVEAWCRARLPAHKIPARWFVVARLPRGPRGKLSRAAAAAAAGAA